MPKLSVYVETSVWSHAFADDAPESREATHRFLDDAREGRYELFVSDVVLDEFARASEETSRRLRGLVSELSPAFLEFDEDAFTLPASTCSTAWFRRPRWMMPDMWQLPSRMS